MPAQAAACGQAAAEEVAAAAARPAVEIIGEKRDKVVEDIMTVSFKKSKLFFAGQETARLDIDKKSTEAAMRFRLQGFKGADQGADIAREVLT